jgi:hypothetical protein
MRYLKNVSFSVGLLFITLAAYTQEKQEYMLHDIGWKITIPFDFTLYDFIDETKNMEEPSGVTDEYDNTMDIFLSQTNIVAIKDRFNYFNITATLFDPEEDGSWENAVQLSKNEAYRNMEKIIDSEKLDTASSIEYIDGIVFNKFHIMVFLNGEIKLHLFLMNKLYRGYDLNITYLSADNDSKEQIELMLRSSRFTKND